MVVMRNIFSGFLKVHRKYDLKGKFHTLCATFGAIFAFNQGMSKTISAYLILIKSSFLAGKIIKMCFTKYIY